METPSLEDRVMQSLARVRTGSGGPDVVEAGVIRAVTASPDGAVRIDVAILPGVPQDIADTIRLVATGVPGVSRAIVDLAQAAGGPPEGTVPSPPPPGNGRCPSWRRRAASELRLSRRARSVAKKQLATRAKRNRCQAYGT